MNSRTPKYDSRRTWEETKGVYGKVHIAFGYCNDEPCSLSFTQNKKDEMTSITEYHRVTIDIKQLEGLIELIKENK